VIRLAASTRRFEREYPVGPEELWAALTASLPCVTVGASFYETARRVEWTIDTSRTRWAQQMTASAEASPNGSALRMTGKTEVRSSLFGRAARGRAFSTLSAAVSEYLARPPTKKPAGRTGDVFRWWNGSEWSYDPPR
jgi:hypothetical protein